MQNQAMCLSLSWNLRGTDGGDCVLLFSAGADVQVVFWHAEPAISNYPPAEPGDSYLPAYSPDLNPIEKLFAKLKAMLRKAAKRTVDALWDEVGKLLDTFSAQECSNYFSSSGYVSK